MSLAWWGAELNRAWSLIWRASLVIWHFCLNWVTIPIPVWCCHEIAELPNTIQFFPTSQFPFTNSGLNPVPILQSPLPILILQLRLQIQVSRASCISQQPVFAQQQFRFSHEKFITSVISHERFQLGEQALQENIHLNELKLCSRIQTRCHHKHG